MQTGPNRYYNIRPDHTFEMPACDAKLLDPMAGRNLLSG